MRLALGFVLAMGAFAGAALWAVRQIDPVVRRGTPPAAVRTVELEVPEPPPREPPPPEEAAGTAEAIVVSPRPEFVESGDEPAPPPGPVVVAAEGPDPDESAALIRRMLSVYRRTVRSDGGAP